MSAVLWRTAARRQVALQSHAANIEPLPAHGHWSAADADLLSVVDASDEDAVPLRRGAGSDGTSADSPAGVGRTDKSS